MYTSKFHDPAAFAKVVNRAVKDLKGVKFDTIVFRGFSGAIVGAPVALRLKKSWVLVRKAMGDSHSSNMVEGVVLGDYIIIDDFIDSGDTINKIVSACKITFNAVCYNNSHCIGVYLYEAAWAKAHDVVGRERVRAKIHGIKVINWSRKCRKKTS